MLRRAIGRLKRLFTTEEDNDMRTIRINSTVASPGQIGFPEPPTDGSDGTDTPAVRREEEDGVEYLVAKTTPIREGVYYYEADDGSINREYLSDEEIRTNAEAWNGEPVTLNHPIDGKGRTTLLTKGNAPTVGEMRVVRADSDDDGVKMRSETWFDTRERGKHDGVFAGVLDAVDDGETVETSIGYDVGTPRANAGVFDGESYEYVQEDITPDHLAILPDGIGNCPVKDGCGIGRLNSALSQNADTGPDGVDAGKLQRAHAALSNALGISSETDGDGDGDGISTSRTNELQSGARIRWEANELAVDTDARYGIVLSTLEIDDSLPVMPYEYVPDLDSRSDTDNVWQPTSDVVMVDEDIVTVLGQFPSTPRTNSDTGTDSDGETDTSTASSGRSTTDDNNDATSQTMQDSEKINELVEEHGLDRENIAPMEGEDCLDTIYQRFDTELAADGGTQTDTGGDDGTETRENESAGITDDQMDELTENLGDVVDERVNEAMEEYENAERHDKLVTEIAANSDYDEERLNDKSLDSLEMIAEQQDTDGSDEESRTNMMGIPEGVERDTAGLGEDDVSDVPTGEWDDYSDAGGD